MIKLCTRSFGYLIVRLSFFTKLLGLEPAKENELAHSEEELRLILGESFKSGEINQAEYKYVNNIFEFDDRVAKEIMVPRTEMICLSTENTLEEKYGYRRN